MDAEGAEDFGAGLEDHIRWSELGLVQSYSCCLWGAFSRVNRPLQLTSVLSRRQLGGVIRERIKKWAREWAKAKQCRRAGIWFFIHLLRVLHFTSVLRQMSCPT